MIATRFGQDHAMRIRASFFELLSHFLEVVEAFDSV
jgi:hypothetical protein